MVEEPHTVTLVVNGAEQVVTVPARRLLCDLLRHELGLTGTHVGCEHGECGACTVRLDGTPVRSCLIFAVSTDGHAVDTIEGLSSAGGPFSLLQEAFHECHALQCGFCTPGLLISADTFLGEMPHPDEQDVREALAGHLCRCTGYQNIVKAVLRAADKRLAPDATGQEEEARP